MLQKIKNAFAEVVISFSNAFAVEYVVRVLSSKFYKQVFKRAQRAFEDCRSADEGTSAWLGTALILRVAATEAAGSDPRLLLKLGKLDEKLAGYGKQALLSISDDEYFEVVRDLNIPDVWWGPQSRTSPNVYH